MKRYKVIAGCVGGRSNKIFQSQDIVTESNFPPGNAEQLVKKGFLEFLDDVEDPQDAIAPTGYEELETEVSGPDEETLNEISLDSETEDSNTDDENPSMESEGSEDGAENSKEDQSLIDNILNGGNENQEEPQETSADEDAETEEQEEESDNSEEAKGGFKMKDITVKELKAELEKMGISFDANASKKELFDLWVKKVS